MGILEAPNKWSQSLFYWNPFCNLDKVNYRFNEFKSQSLFYWNPFCNIKSLITSGLVSLSRNPYFIGILSAICYTLSSSSLMCIVAILILLESFLQFNDFLPITSNSSSRNPYFIGILSAIP